MADEVGQSKPLRWPSRSVGDVIKALSKFPVGSLAEAFRSHGGVGIRITDESGEYIGFVSTDGDDDHFPEGSPDG